MLRAFPKGWFSSKYTILENDSIVAIIATSAWRESAQLALGGSVYRMYRQGLMSGSFVLEGEGAILARAEKPSAFYRSFVVQFDGKEFTLAAESAMYRKFVLSEGGNPIGSVYPEHALTTKAVIDFPEEIPLAGRLFMFWLVMVLWKRASDAAAAT